MDPNKTSIERAFEFARSGECKTVGEIKRRLKSEGYDPHLVHGKSLYAQLKAVIAAALGDSDAQH
jgi:hypothetical protein